MNIDMDRVNEICRLLANKDSQQLGSFDNLTFERKAIVLTLYYREEQVEATRKLLPPV